MTSSKQFPHIKLKYRQATHRRITKGPNRAKNQKSRTGSLLKKFECWLPTDRPNRLQFLRERVTRAILHHETLTAALSFALGSNVPRRRSPILAEGAVHPVVAETRSIVGLGELGRTAHVHDLLVVGSIGLPGFDAFGVRVKIAGEVNNCLLEELCQCRVYGRDEWRGRVILLFFFGKRAVSMGMQERCRKRVGLTVYPVS